MGEVTRVSDPVAAAGSFRWIQPSWKRRVYELRDGNDAVIATFEYRGKWQARPTLSFDGVELEFQRRGFWKTSTAIMRGTQEIALFRPKSTTGEIVFMNGRKFLSRRKGFFSSNYDIATSDNVHIMTLKNTPRLFRSECSLTVEPAAAEYPETRVLMAWGWYLMLAAAQAASAVVGAP